jgi:FAD/FMN-containing dehydrogenase
VQGARSGLVAAGLADGDVVLSLERLNRAPLIDAANRTVEVDAGVTLSTLNDAAAEHGLTFPIDLGADPTVGGMVAANTAGARFLRHGDVRRNLLGLEVVLSDAAGTRLELGRALWKDNSGLDLKHLFTCSAGALGVVTRATLALQPLPANRVTALVAVSKAESALSLLLNLEQSAGTLLTAFEGISATALDLAFRHVPRLRRPFSDTTKPGYCVLIELAAGAGVPVECLSNLIEQSVGAMLEHGSATDAVVDQGHSLWSIRHAIPEGLRACGTTVACDVSVRRGDVMAFRSVAAAEVAKSWPELIVADFGHIGDGGLHFNLVWPHDAGPLPDGTAAAVRSHIFEIAVERFGGSFSAEHGVGPRNIDDYVRFTPAPVRLLAGQIQRLVAPTYLGRVDFGTKGRENA